MLRFPLFFAVTLSLFAADPTLFRTPTVNQTDIVFSYAGDLWTVHRGGGQAQRLTAGSGSEALEIAAKHPPDLVILDLGLPDLDGVDVIHGLRGKAVHEWATRQAYIALGNLMTCAAMLGVDTCPMEGFISAEYDRVLNLAESGYTSVVNCALGYRSEKDKNANLPKVRFDASELIRKI